jgi:tetratricopeptide (TPR) repeat protein
MRSIVAPALLTTLTAFGLTCTPVGGQVSPMSSMPQPDAPLAQRVDSLYGRGLHQESLALLDQRIATAPDDYLAHVLAGRAALVLGYGASQTDVPKAKEWLHRAIAYGERAMALQPLGEDGRYITLAAEGRLGLIESGFTKARLAVVVDSAARSLIAQDSMYAGAHNALGRLYLEIRSLSWVERIIARHWLGGELMSRATWEAADHELRRAVELQPGRNLYYADLGRMLIKRDSLDEARAVLQAGLKVPLEFPEEEHFRDEMRRLLARIDRRGADGDSTSTGS